MSRNVSVAVASAQISVRPDVLWRVLADRCAPDEIEDGAYDALLSRLNATEKERAVLSAARAAPRAQRPARSFERRKWRVG